jgi:hypothetical protein
MGERRDVLVTGLPRGGTTLTCELLDSLPDTVALDEPLRPRTVFGPRRRVVRSRVLVRLRVAHLPFLRLDPVRVCDRIDEYLAATRASINERGVVVTKQVDGRVFGGRVSDECDEAGIRLHLAERAEIAVDETLPPDFTLVVKQNALFAALLPELRRRHPLYAIVRNPLSVLSSWQTVPFSVRDGHSPTAEALDRTLTADLARIDDPLDRQLRLLDWFFGCYRALPPKSILRYEDIVTSGGSALAAITPAAATLDRPLESRSTWRSRASAPNRGAALTRVRGPELAERLLASEGAYWHVYTRGSVADLIAGADSAGS